MFKKTVLNKALTLIIFLTMLPMVSVAQDITNEQRNAYEARQALNKKASAHQALVTRVSQQEKRVQDEQARLNKLVSEEQAAKQALDQAKLNLEDKVNKLNAVWDLRDR